MKKLQGLLLILNCCATDLKYLKEHSECEFYTETGNYQIALSYCKEETKTDKEAYRFLAKINLGLAREKIVLQEKRNFIYYREIEKYLNNAINYYSEYSKFYGFEVIKEELEETENLLEFIKNEERWKLLKIR